jgi:hypothetical protein
MWLMAGVAGHALCVVRGHDLWECLGLRTVRFVTATANNCRIELRRLDAGGIIGMLRLGTVASFAGYNYVLPKFLLIHDIGVAAFTNLVPSMCDGPRRDLGNRVAPIMSILSEALRNHRRPNCDENAHQNHYNGGKPYQMPGIFEQSAPTFATVA